jgi:hypothetical protein
MKAQSLETSAVAISTRSKIDDIKRQPLFRFGVFALSIAGTCFLFRLAYEFVLLPSLGAHARAGTLLNVLKTLPSGFGN